MLELDNRGSSPVIDIDYNKVEGKEYVWVIATLYLPCSQVSCVFKATEIVWNSI